MGFDPTYRYGAMRGVAPDGGDKHLLSMIDRVVKARPRPNVSRVTVRVYPFWSCSNLRATNPPSMVTALSSPGHYCRPGTIWPG